MDVKWTTEMVEHFIAALQEHPCLYSISSKEYLDRNLKAKAWNAIVANMKSFNNGINVEAVKKKLKNLRTQYCRECKLLEQSKKSGAGLDDVYTPKLWYFHQLNFLKHHLHVRESTTNVNIDNLIDSHEIPMTDVASGSASAILDELVEEPPKSCSQNSHSTSPYVAKKKNSYSKQRMEHLASIKQLLHKRKEDKSKFDWLGKLVTANMDNIHKDDQMNAAWEVQVVMRKYIDICRQKKQDGASSSSSQRNIDILELSMDDVFEAAEFHE